MKIIRPPMLIGEAIYQTSSFYEELGKISNHFVIITDSNVKKLYGNALQKALRNASFDVILLHFEAGEEHKTRETKSMIEDAMLNNGVTREWGIIALGGGVVTDIAGFVASTYLRGLTFVSMPTTLLAMCDAAHGGKNGINTSAGKNTIGSFYNPNLILIDTTFLNTLNEIEMQNGLAEILKIAILCDKNLLEQVCEKGLNPIEKIVTTAIKYKYQVIEKKGERDLLNFGHTIGHAIERATNYQVPHGQAIAIGMVAESANVRPIFERFSYPLECSVSKDAMMEAIKSDKKRKKNAIRLARIPKMGHAQLEWISLDEIEGMIDAMHNQPLPH